MSLPARAYPDTLTRADALERYRAVRTRSEDLCATLEPEDFVVQSMPDASPTKWHLAHTTWFFEGVILRRFVSSYTPHDDRLELLFNSYYESLGPRWARHRRGLLTRPTVEEVFTYRRAVDERIVALLESCSAQTLAEAAPLLEIGIAHEEQHGELLLTDIKHVLAINPLRPALRTQALPARGERPAPPRFRDFEGGLREVGAGAEHFAYDNERPRHTTYLHDYSLAERAVSNGEFLEFIEDGGYEDFRHWLSDGWTRVQEDAWEAPLYWERRDGAWWLMTLGGMRPLDPAETCAHVSFYEAAAYARWAGARLPTEAEWECAAESLGAPGANFQDDGRFHPDHARAEFGDLFGSVWEWTASPYLPYPGYEEYPGPLGEYNGKFMSGQVVLRGGSCATPRGHIRRSYRNFFQPEKRWQFSGLRLAR